MSLCVCAKQLERRERAGRQTEDPTAKARWNTPDRPFTCGGAAQAWEERTHQYCTHLATPTRACHQAKESWTRRRRGTETHRHRHTEQRTLLLLPSLHSIDVRRCGFFFAIRPSFPSLLLANRHTHTRIRMGCKRKSKVDSLPPLFCSLNKTTSSPKERCRRGEAHRAVRSRTAQGGGGEEGEGVHEGRECYAASAARPWRDTLAPTTQQRKERDPP